MPPGMIHPKPHNAKGKGAYFYPATNTLPEGVPRGKQRVLVNDWYDRVVGGSWMDHFGDSRTGPGTGYARRRAKDPTALPRDDQVVIVSTQNGKVIAVHQSELRKAVQSEPMMPGIDATMERNARERKRYEQQPEETKRRIENLEQRVQDIERAGTGARAA